MHKRELDTEEIDKMLNQGTIEPSESPWAAPIVFVKELDFASTIGIKFQNNKKQISTCKNRRFS